jgi:hypothetical protein
VVIGYFFYKKTFFDKTIDATCHKEVYFNK